MQEKLFIDSKDGKVCLIHTRKDKNLVVILGHGYISNKESRTNIELSKRLNEAGISTIAFDMYGHGESEGNIERVTVSKVVENVISVYDFAKSNGYTKIGLSGSSFSGIVSLISATKREFSVLALKCPVFDSKKLWDWRLGKEGLERWKKEGFITPFGKKWSYEAYEDASNYNMAGIVQKIRAPVLIIHGNEDKTVPISHAESINRYLQAEKKLMIIDGADHFFRNSSHFEKMVENSYSWLKNHLKH